MLKQFLENTALKNQDLKKVYSLIHKYGPLRKAELIEKTEIKKTTLVRMLDELLKNGFIKENGFGDSYVGRPPILYDVEADRHYLIGVHISRMKTNIVLLNLRYKLLEQESFVMTSMHTPEFVVIKIEQIIRKFMEKHNFNEKTLIGIGLATIGPLNRNEGMILEPESFLAANWSHVPIVKMVQEKFQVKVLLEKGANAAAIAGRYSTGFIHKNILYCISGGWGMDCGVIVDEMIFRDPYVDKGGYGHMIIDMNGNLCSCGKRGCIVAYTSFKNIIQELRRETVLTGNMREEIFEQATLKDMMEYFKQGDKHTEEVIIRSSRYLGVGLSNLVNLFNPELLVLSGPFIEEMEGYYEEVVNHIVENIQNKSNVTFSKGMLGGNASAVGAAILLFDTYLLD